MLYSKIAYKGYACCLLPRLLSPRVSSATPRFDSPVGGTKTGNWERPNEYNCLSFLTLYFIGTITGFKSQVKVKKNGVSLFISNVTEILKTDLVVIYHFPMI